MADNATPDRSSSGELVCLEHISEHRIDLVLNRPAKLNALTADMLQRILELTLMLRRTSPRVVVVRSTSTRAFCVGADINEQQQLSPVSAYALSELGSLAFEGINALSCPVVAQVDGHCLGGGLELALACDLRIGDSGTRMAFPETGLGNSPSWGGAARLTTLVGPSRAMELMLTGVTIEADRALSIGLLNQVSTGSLADTVNELCATLVTKAPIAQTAVKRSVQTAVAQRHLFHDAPHAAFQSTTDDSRVGKDAFTASDRTTLFKGQ